MKKRSEYNSIFNIALPIIIQGLVLQIQILIDKAFLGHLNSEYFSAVGNVLFPYFLTIESVHAIATGTTILVAQNIGAKKEFLSKTYSEVSFAYNTLLSLILFLIWFIFPENIFKLMGVKSPILEYSVRYVRFLSFSLVFLGADSTAGAILQGIGFTRPIMYVGFIKNLLNVLLDWILIFGKLGFPAMNLEGAALATSISEVTGGIILILMVLFSKKRTFKISVKNIIMAKFKHYTDVIKIGLPTGLESFTWHIGNLVLISFLNTLDKMATGIYTLIFHIEIVPYMIYLGIAKAAITLVGQKTGARDHGGAIDVGSMCLKYSIFICIACALVFIFFRSLF